MKDAETATDYAIYVMKARWLEAEDVILNSKFEDAYLSFIDEWHHRNSDELDWD